jgi:hypothetical protein
MAIPAFPSKARASPNTCCCRAAGAGTGAGFRAGFGDGGGALAGMAAHAPTWSIAAHAIANPKRLANDVMTALLLKTSPVSSVLGYAG